MLGYNSSMKLLKELQQLILHELIIRTWTVLTEIKTEKDGISLNIVEDSIDKGFVTLPYKLPKETNFHWKDIELNVPTDGIYCKTKDRSLVVPLHCCVNDKQEIINSITCKVNVHAKEDGFVLFVTGNKASTVYMPQDAYKEMLKRQ
jgi:hypothetical protein